MDKTSAIGYCLLAIRYAIWLSAMGYWLFASAKTTNQERETTNAKVSEV
jgi:hypothetical protein